MLRRFKTWVFLRLGVFKDVLRRKERWSSVLKRFKTVLNFPPCIKFQFLVFKHFHTIDTTTTTSPLHHHLSPPPAPLPSISCQCQILRSLYINCSNLTNSGFLYWLLIHSGKSTTVNKIPIDHKALLK